MHVSPISHLQLHQKKEKKIRPKVHPLLYHTFYNCCNSGKMSSMFWGGKLFNQNCWEFFFSHSFHLYFHYFIRSVVFEIAPCDSMSLITVLATIKIILESDSIFLLCSISLKVTVHNWTSQSVFSPQRKKERKRTQAKISKKPISTICSNNYCSKAKFRQAKNLTQVHIN